MSQYDDDRMISRETQQLNVLVAHIIMQAALDEKLSAKQRAELANDPETSDATAFLNADAVVLAESMRLPGATFVERLRGLSRQQLQLARQAVTCDKLAAMGSTDIDDNIAELD